MRHELSFLQVTVGQSFAGALDTSRASGHEPRSRDLMVLCAEFRSATELGWELTARGQPNKKAPWEPDVWHRPPRLVQWRTPWASLLGVWEASGFAARGVGGAC